MMHNGFFHPLRPLAGIFWNNWKAVFLVVFCLAGSLELWNALLTRYIKIPAFVNPIYTKALQKNLYALSAAKKILHAQRPGRPLGLILGASMLSFDLDYAVLTENDNLDWDWLLLGGHGCDLICTKAIMRSMDNYSLYPDVVIFMSHLFQFQRLNFNAGNQRQMIHQTPVNSWENYFFPARQRERILAVIKNTMIKIQLSLEPFGFTLPIAKNSVEHFQPMNPWRSLSAKDEKEYQRRQSPQRRILRLQRVYKEWRQHGFFNPAAYNLTYSDSFLWDKYRDLMKHYTRRGVKVFILLSPLHTLARKSLPNVAYQNVLNLFESGDPESIPVIDMTAGIPDELMHEISHANSIGQRHFSLSMAKMLNRLIRSQYREFPVVDMAAIQARPMMTDQDVQSYFIPPPDRQRLKDLKKLKAALNRYHKKHKNYPKSRGFNGLYSQWGDSGSTWIAGLVPDFLPELPRDPRQSSIPNQQYLYRSNGKEYKLLAVSPESCQSIRINSPEFIDPLRGCGALALWSHKTAANW